MSILNKNDSAFTNAYSEYYKLVFSNIYRKIPNFEISQDLCQEVFLRLFIKFGEVINIRTWLYGTIRNVVLEYFRRKKTSPINIETVSDIGIIMSDNEHNDSRLLIDEALNNVENFGDENGKLMFDLIAVHKHTYREAGLKLGMSERQVRYRYGLIIEKLHRHFSRKGIHCVEELL